jgi:hypothetical protein
MGVILRRETRQRDHFSVDTVMARPSKSLPGKKDFPVRAGALARDYLAVRWNLPKIPRLIPMLGGDSVRRSDKARIDRLVAEIESRIGGNCRIRLISFLDDVRSQAEKAMFERLPARPRRLASHIASDLLTRRPIYEKLKARRGLKPVKLDMKLPMFAHATAQRRGVGRNQMPHAWRREFVKFARDAGLTEGDCWNLEVFIRAFDNCSANGFGSLETWHRAFDREPIR